ncbi:LPP20 family lipoprotein [Oceanobacter mangrovi]|uniref:LPP20 family lipoprotein n=1 Tax=Oceanobacter mangrovi TaxID=2862510 RepID=UPI001C8EA186|nr:LPP20 family lipoprotein [Oceanobacter mangrovi]
MKMRNLLVTMAAATTLAACSGNTQQQAAVECAFPGTTQAAPSWVCGEAPEGVELSAVGFADKSGAGMNFMKQMAAAQARTELASTMKVQVSNMIKQYAETTGAGDDESVDMVNTSVTKQITSETLIGSRILRQISTPTGGLVVLVGLDPAGVSDIAEQAVKTSMANDRALWQKFQAEKGFDELATEIANMKAQ